MKLVFLDTGDYIEFEPENNPFIEHWLQDVFDRDLNEYNMNSSTYDKIEMLRNQFNEDAYRANLYAVSKIKKFKPFLPELSELDQDALNDAHKRWVTVTESHTSKIHPQPDYWKRLNDTIHEMERFYHIFFANKKIKYHLTDKYLDYLKPEYCEYESHDLIINFGNLGRHQYNQWLTNSKVDEETNNYNIVPLNFEYHFNIDINPGVAKTPAHPEYIKWCKENNLEVIPPVIPLGKFKKYHRNEVRKLIHRNLKNNTRAKFSYD